MHRRLIAHLRGNVVGYVALFAALGGTSYAAVRLTANSVTTRAVAPGAITHAKLAPKSVSGANIIDGSLKRADFAPGTLAALVNGSGGTAMTGATGAPANGSRGATGPAGPAGPAGATGPAGSDGSAAIIARARTSGSVTAPHGATTGVPVGQATWTQAPGELALLTGSVTLATPASCTGSFGNSLLIQVDGSPATFAVAPNSPASTTLTMPINVTSVMEPSSTASHRVTASLANSCTKGGEDFTVQDVRIDVVKFR
jgi:hypothetical protein